MMTYSSHIYEFMAIIFVKANRGVGAYIYMPSVPTDMLAPFHYCEFTDFLIFTIILVLSM